VRPLRLVQTVLVVAATAGCDAAADRPVTPERAPAPPPAPAPFADRLTAREPPAPIASNRNPFRFGNSGTNGRGREGRPGAARLPPAEGLPELPLPISAPPLRLLGVATHADGSRVAVMLVGADLVLARQGERLASRYTVTAIGDEAVELTDAVGERPMRLALP
jgi:hypothetical protein